MLSYSDASVFDVGAQTLVNTVNCEGVMGAGLALEFKLRHPAMFADYAERCARKDVQVGHPYLYRQEACWILNFPTKRSWKHPSKLAWIDEGLARFARRSRDAGFTKVAFPLLGCSKGGLAWDEVRPLMERHLTDLPFDVVICFDRHATPGGLEHRMVAVLNGMDAQALNAAGLRGAIADRVAEALPITRFRDLMAIKGFGERSYATLFEAARRAEAPTAYTQLALEWGR